MTFKNAINWFEIPATDLDRATNFYQTIFECELIPMDLGDNFKMRRFPTNEETTGGAIVYNTEFYKPSTDGTLVYLNGNPDLANVLSRVEAAGGRVLMPKTEISPEYGFMGLFIDTEGNRVGLHSSPVK